VNKAEILAFMQAASTCYVATVEGNEPRVRAIMIYKVTKDEIIIQTNVNKDFTRQMKQNPNVEILFHDPKQDMMQVRVRGKVEQVTDPAALAKAMEDRPFLKAAAEQGNGPALYRVKNPQAYVWTIQTNNDPKTFVKL